MKLIEQATALHAWAQSAKAGGQQVALVPTMGFLHEGHLSLVRLARTHADSVVTSIFVNPTQFAPHEDLARYPRDIKGDIEKLRSAGCDVVFVPTADEVYSDGFSTAIDPGPLAKTLCGESRPGHFRGVATVVLILVRISGADILVLGEKDFQQLTVVRRMMRDLWLGARVVSGPTIRDPDGLAMSSRNSYLNNEERQWATSIPRALKRGATQFARGDRSVPSLLKTVYGTLTEAPIEVEYAQIVDASTLKPITVVQRDAVIAVAARVGTTRLIDNCRLTI